MIEVRNIDDFNDYLESLLLQNESDDLEFKSAAGGFPGSFWDTYSAFANTDGGTIVFGVQEKKGKFYIDNLTEEQIEKYRKDFWNNVNNTSTISRNLMRKEDVVIGNYKGFPFMLFFVPRAPREFRPVYRTNEPYKGNIYEQQEPDKVVLVMPMESFLSEETKAKLTEKFGIVANSFDHHVLSILALACDEGAVTNTRLRYSLSLHKAEIANILKLMTQKGLLITEGHGRGMRYLLPEKKPDFLNVATSEANVETSDGSNVATSEAKVATSEAKVATSEVKVATSEAKVATSIKKKMSREELQALILSVCTEWISLEELSVRIDRDSKYLRNQIIPLMLASKKLQMLFPGTPNHPNQQYKVSD